MKLLKLPSELFEQIIHEVLSNTKIEDSLKYRGVCSTCEVMFYCASY